MSVSEHIIPISVSAISKLFSILIHCDKAWEQFFESFAWKILLILVEVKVLHLLLHSTL